MMRRALRLSIVLLPALVSACAMTYGSKFVPTDPGPVKSLVYVYRVPSISGSAMSAQPMVMLDGGTCRTIKNGGYFAIVLQPGNHVLALKSALFGISFGDERKSIAFDIKPGETKYVEYAQITTGYNRYGNTEVAEVKEHFVEMPGGYAEIDIAKTRLLSADSGCGTAE